MRHFWFLASFLLFANSSFAMMKKNWNYDPQRDVCFYDNRWTGFTVGFNLGALINATEGDVKPTGDFKLPANTSANPQRTDSFDMHGAAFITGVQVGYNYQMKVLVIGAETDFNYCTLDKQHTLTKNLVTPLTGTFHDRVTQLFNWYGTVRGRVGYAVKAVPILIYTTGGFSYGHVKSKTEVDFSHAGDRYEGSSSKWRIGWNLGVGLEWSFVRHWSMKTEYLYQQLRDTHYRDSNSPPPSFPTFSYRSELENQAHLVRIGFNYTI